MFDGLGIPVGTICALLDLGIQASRVIGCVYGRVARLEWRYACEANG
jgi:hypothetical protein